MGVGSSQELSVLTPDTTFDATASVNLVNSTITIDNHGYYTGEMVRYLNGGNNSGNVGGLDNGQVYYVIVKDPNTIQLALTLADALKATPVPVTLTSCGTGTDSLVAPSSTQVFDPATQVDLGNSTITIDSHGYLSGQEVMYENGGGTSIGGLTNNRSTT